MGAWDAAASKDSGPELGEIGTSVVSCKTAGTISELAGSRLGRRMVKDRAVGPPQFPHGLHESVCWARANRPAKAMELA